MLTSTRTGDLGGSAGGGIGLDGSLPDQLVRDLIEDSYDLVVSGLPKRARNQLGWAVREAEDPA